MRSIQVNGMTFDELYDTQQLNQIVTQIANQLNHDYAGKHPLMVCVLNGAAVFGMDLFKKLTMDVELTFVRLKSYEGEGTSGHVNELIPLQVDIHDRDVIIVEDVVDTGTTLHTYKAKLETLGSRSIRLAALFYKPGKLQYEDAKPDYFGEAIGNPFIIGYGFDIDEHYRNLDAIYAKRD